MDRGAAVVQRRGCGMIGYSWGGFRRTPDGGPASAGAARGRHRQLDGPPLHGRLPLHRRVRERPRHALVGNHDARLRCSTSRPGDRRPALARRCGSGVSEVAPPMIERWLAAPARGRLLAPWIGRVARLRGRSRCLRCWRWAAGPLIRIRNAVLRVARGASSLLVFRPDRSVGARLPTRNRTGPDDCLPVRVRALLRALPARRSQRLRRSEPQLRVYMQDFDRPSPKHDARSGRWISLAQWPPVDARPDTLALGDRSLRPRCLSDVYRRQDTEVARGSREPPAGSVPDELRAGSVQANGLSAGNWCPYGGPSQPLDQRSDDAFSLCFDSAELREPLEILGFPRLRLRVRADRPRAVVIARLCDLSPEGESLLVTRGVLNLAHRAGARPGVGTGAGRAGHGGPEARLRGPSIRPRTPRAARDLAHLLAVGVASSRGGHPVDRCRRLRTRAAKMLGAHSPADLGQPTSSSPRLRRGVDLAEPVQPDRPP